MWATAQERLGLALVKRAIRGTHEQRTTQLNEGINAYNRALEVFTRAGMTQDRVRVEQHRAAARKFQ
jgi:hypothetical protein